MAIPGAVVQRQQLRTELKKARTKSRLTQLQVAERMDWSPSKLIRIEAGQVGISTNDLRALLREYGITDAEQTEYFLGLARASRRMPYREYRGLLSKPYMDLLSYESSASIVRTFEPLLIPGLLQTEEYSRALSRAFSPGISGDRLDRLIEVRQQRQELLESEGRPEFFFVLDEAALHRWIGGPRVMNEQLNRLKEIAARPGITIQVVPFQVGAHAGLLGPFVLLEFDGDIDHILYQEKYAGESVFSDDTAATAEYLERFWDLEQLAPPADLPSSIDRALDGLEERVDGTPLEEVDVVT
ncbi:helix-turn-helix transcriptional regulator [Streptomyces sp. UNOB3_S3]|uniref:helix-turn-helix domain-containing protein n=1 Tax=Streptomyces sp. UNOB3_S3 TaxID=2871682 RepID=UPI001E5C10ED|nr:helix-turn-helix transcriptional regulator [Streptomyces sp. UNOB3_S3]MCC3776916.1 helix-turn-helix transcriptional regulator [Streptomyces sp. UNOB3_S3]